MKQKRLQKKYGCGNPDKNKDAGTTNKIVSEDIIDSSELVNNKKKKKKKKHNKNKMRIRP